MYVTVEKLVFGGKALARSGGKAVFIPFALPDEELEITLTADRRDYSEAVIKKILNPSPHRVTPPCPHFGVCGGCNLQTAEGAYQHRLRTSMVEELLTRARLVPEQPLIFTAGPEWEYRNRFQFHADKHGAIGLHGFASTTVVPVRDCPIAVPALRRLIRQGRLAELFLRERRGGKDRGHVFAQETVYSPVNPLVSARVRDRVLDFSVLGFFQSNLTMLEKLIEPVCALPACTRVLDFYAGVGTFSAFLIGSAEEIHLVEHNARALDTARSNLNRIIAETGASCRCFFHAVSDAEWPGLQAAQRSFDAAVIDPPRQGMHEGLFAYLRNAGIPRLHYVSCNPPTFVRDAQKLTALGYRFVECRLFDFYPQTHHCELLGVFIR